MPKSIPKTRLVSEGASLATFPRKLYSCKSYPVTPIHLMFSQDASQSSALTPKPRAAGSNESLSHGRPTKLHQTRARSRGQHERQKSPLMVPGFESAGLVSTNMTRSVLTPSSPSQTTVTTGLLATYFTNLAKNGFLERSASWKDQRSTSRAARTSWRQDRSLWSRSA